MKTVVSCLFGLCLFGTLLTGLWPLYPDLHIGRRIYGKRCKLPGLPAQFDTGSPYTENFTGSEVVFPHSSSLCALQVGIALFSGEFRERSLVRFTVQAIEVGKPTFVGVVGLCCRQ